MISRPTTGGGRSLGAVVIVVVLALAASRVHGDDRGVLMNLFNSTGGARWTNSLHWGGATDVCGWYGVECDGARVSSLTVHDNNLNGA